MTGVTNVSWYFVLCLTGVTNVSWYFILCLTGVTNASFHVGSARRLLKTFLAEGNILTDETVAVVNPSRNGLSKMIIPRSPFCLSGQGHNL